MRDNRETPNEQLSTQIIEELAEKGLIPTDRKHTIRQKFFAAKATSSDWRLWAEQVIKEEESNAKASRQQ